jgi:hypothetical protein
MAEIENNMNWTLESSMLIAYNADPDQDNITPNKIERP